MSDPLRLTIELGHVATDYDTSSHCSPDDLTTEQKMILEAIQCSARADWNKPFVVTNVDTTNDDWVAQVLEEEINSKLYVPPSTMPPNTMPTNTVRILKDHVVWPSLHPESGKPLPTSPDPGTQCRLVGEKWINSRTYYLYGSGGGKWLFDANSKHIAIATLTWLCRTLNPCKPDGNAMPL
ncbi:MAG: hypothetical protein R3F29_06150 [Planctomycetota bacterium]